MIDPYQVLGIPRNASEEDIKKAEKADRAKRTATKKQIKSTNKKFDLSNAKISSSYNLKWHKKRL